MKTNKYEKRFYRDWVRARDLYLAHIVLKETDVQVLTNKPFDKNFLKERLGVYRLAIESYIAEDARFLTALKPLEVELHAAPIVKEMAKCAKAVNVGPMAGVAGAVAEFLGRDLMRKGCKDVIVENGGDLFLKTRRIRKIGIYTGRSRLWRYLALKVKPKDTPLGICTSSGTIGHSLSFGCADSVTVLSKNACLADAAATATANRVNSKKDLQRSVDFAMAIHGVVGVAIIIKDALISCGKIEFAIS